jgi:hypothetical protein
VLGVRAARIMTALALVAGGCAGGCATVPPPAPAKAQAQGYAEQMAGLLDSVAAEESSGPNGCAGGVRNEYSVPVPTNLPEPPLAHFRTVWKANGFPVTERGVADGRTGTISTVTPDGYQVVVTRPEPTVRLSMTVTSPCPAARG